MPELTSPSAFELCKDGKCSEAVIKDWTEGTKTIKVATCDQDKDKCGGGCYCQLFRRKKGSDKDTWDVVRVNDHNVNTDYDDNYDYQCFCVTPILETTVTKDDVEYPVHFILCGSDDCSLKSTVDVGQKKTVTKLKCDGKCDGVDCKCTMFRLQVKKAQLQKDLHMKWSPKNAKWEYVKPEDREYERDEGIYYYRCFCVKTVKPAK